jgi:hypothetical protein
MAHIIFTFAFSLHLFSISLFSIFYRGSNVVLVPVLCFIADMIENTTLYLMLGKHRTDGLVDSAENNYLASQANVANLAKYFMVFIIAVLIIFGSIRQIRPQRSVQTYKTKRA